MTPALDGDCFWILFLWICAAEEYHLGMLGNHVAGRRVFKGSSHGVGVRFPAIAIVDKISILRYLEDEEDTMYRCKLSSMDKLENTGKRE